MSPLTRKAARAVGLVAAVAVAFAGGVVAGLTDREPKPSAAAAGQGVLDQAADRIAAQAVRPVDRDQLERAAVEGMLKSLGDRWSAYYDPAQFSSFADSVEGHYAGVGVWLRSDGEGHVVVASVQADSSAGRAGVAPGDRIVSVDGAPARDADSAAAMLRGSRAAGVAVGAEGAVASAAQAAGTEVRLVLVRGSEQRDVTLRREVMADDDVVTSPLRGGVLRVSVHAFTRGVGREVRAALQVKPAPGGVVLDLRGNPGGLLTEAVEVASAFLDGGPVVVYQKRGEPSRTLEALGHGDTRTPLVVLVDGRTASAAEVVAGALQDRNRAVVVGGVTYGKGSVQEPSRLSDGSAIELTVGRYLTPSGRSVDGVGIQPDVLVADDAGAGKAEERALEVLSGLQAALGAGGRG
jgi:carboxyl-terminal processing protease